MAEFDRYPSMPDFNAEHHPTFEEFLGRLQNGTLSEIVGTDGFRMVFIDTSSHTGDSVWPGPDNDFVYSFNNKFRQGFEGWQPGQVVNARFVLTRTREGLGLLVSDDYIGDIRHSDTFTLSGLSEEQTAALRGLGIAVIDADVEVTGPGRYQVSNMFDYPASVRRINAIQIPWDGETEPQIGQQVLVQGQVVRYAPGKADYENASFPKVEVRLPNGRIVSIEMTSGHIKYEGGNLDFLYPEGPQEGDVVQINTTFSNPSSNWHAHRNRRPTFHAPFCRSAFLLHSSAKRMANYEAHRADIAGRMTRLRALNGQAFRSAYADLMHAYTEPADKFRGWPRLLLTRKERSLLKELVDRKFPNDPRGNLSPERPLTDFGHFNEMHRIKQAYGVDVFGMSRREFFAFCLDIANGRRTVDHSQRGGTASPYEVLSSGDEAFSPQEQFEVYQQAIEYWLPYIKGKKVVYDDVVDPERQVSYRYQTLVVRSIELIDSAAKALPEAREYVYDLAMQVLQEVAEDRGQLHWTDRDIPHALCSTLYSIVAGTAVRDETRREWVGVKDRAGLNYFVGKLPELLAVMTALEAKKSSLADEVLNVMKAIGKINVLPNYTA